MATVDLQGTSFSLSILPTKKKEGIKTKIAVENEYLQYEDEGEYFTIEELEDLLSVGSRLLAGGYEKEYSLSFYRAGLAVDFYAYTREGRAVSRAERRENDCVMAVRFLFRSPDKKQFLDGVYTLLFHREQIELFLKELRAEFMKNVAHRIPGRGKYAFVGVSPLGYVGCNYLYFDPTKKVKAGEYVWVRMGRHNTEQIVCVDSVRYYGDEDTPYNPKTVKQILRKATKEEIKNL